MQALLYRDTFFLEITSLKFLQFIQDLYKMLHTNFQGVECWGTYRGNIWLVFTTFPYINVQEKREKSILINFKNLIDV